MEITEKEFGEQARLFVLKNNQGIELSVTDYGARIVSLKVPVDGNLQETVLGFDTAKEYIEKDPYIGATIGRFAGRIKDATVNIDGVTHKLKADPKSDHQLHGGNGFHNFYWQATKNVSDDEVSVTFTLKSADGAEGFPGNLVATVQYRLTNNNEWIIDYAATTDKPTIYNPTNHVYFNLTGDPSIPIDTHTLRLQADHYVEVDEAVIATGRILPTLTTAFDFSREKRLAELFAAVTPLAIDGLDHPFLLNQDKSPQAILTGPDGKIKIEMTTDAPAVVIFTANFGDDGVVMKGKKVAHHGGITFETQIPPSATQYPELGELVLRPKEEYHQQTVFKLYID